MPETMKTLFKYSYVTLLYSGPGFEENPTPVGCLISAKIRDNNKINLLRNCASTGFVHELPIPDVPTNGFQRAHHAATMAGLGAAFQSFARFIIGQPFFNSMHARQMAVLIHPFADSIEECFYSWSEEYYASAPGADMEEFREATAGIMRDAFNVAVGH